MMFQDESGGTDTEASYSCDAELDDETIGKAPSSPLFIQEREEPANRRQAYHSHEESLLPAQSFLAHASTDRTKNENQVAKWKTKESGFSLKDKKEQILAEVRTEIQRHELQADSDRRSIQELTGVIGSQRREIDHTLACDEKLRRDQLPLQEQLPEPHRDLREAHEKSLNEMEELKRFKALHSMQIRGEKLVEDRDTILELRGQNSGIAEGS